MAISPPTDRAHPAAVTPSESSPFHVIESAAIVAGGPQQTQDASVVTDLPDPDSPTMARSSPGPTSKRSRRPP